MRTAFSRLVLLVSAVTSVDCSQVPPRPARPDIVLISIDTLRADFLGFAGRKSARTPTIDGLARDGTRFDNAFTPMTRTTPAIASLMTGLWPKHHRSQEVGQPMEHGVTLAEILAGAGYRAVGVSANAAASPSHNVTRGFAEFVDSADIKSRHDDRIYRHGTKADASFPGWAGVTTAEALALTKAAPDETPLFLWVHYFDPHLVYRPPSPWQDQVEAPVCWELYEEYAVRRPEASWRVFGDFGGIASRALEDCQALYDAEIAYTDHEMGKLLDGVTDGRRNPDGVLVIVTADHGENFGEGGSFFEHGENVRDASAAVPLIFSGRGVAEGRVDRGTVSLVDVAPTLMEWLSLTATATGAPSMDGRSLAARISRSGAPHGEDDPRVVFSESASALRNQSYVNLLTGRAFERACINDARFTLCDVFESEPREPKLFDHVDDPGLAHDIADRHPEVVARLRDARRLWPPESARYRAAIRGRFKLVETPLLEGGYRSSLHDREADPGEDVDVLEQHRDVAEHLGEQLGAWTRDTRYGPSLPDPEMTEALRSLGYVQ